MTSLAEHNQLSSVLAQIHKRYFGKGPLSISVALQAHCIVIRVSGILTPLEKSLSATIDGAGKVENIRAEIMQRFRDTVISDLSESSGFKITGVMYQVFVDLDEAILVLFHGFTRKTS